MLRELHISNLAVISDVRVELGPGLNCFTGATGAGKSLVIGAIEVLLGLRSPAEMLRPGVDEGRVSGVFEVASPELLAQLRAVTDVDVTSDGGEVLLTRRLYASGRSSVSLNGNPITLGMLRQVGERLVDVHGQHDHQYLLKAANQIEVLDQFGSLLPARRAYHEVYERLVTAKARLADLSANRTLREQQLELYRFQADEIDTVGLDPAEHHRLTVRASILQNQQRLRTDAGAAHAELYEADGAVVDRLKTSAGAIEALAELDPALKPIAAGLRDAAIAAEEVAFDLSRYLDKLDHDPAELAATHDRLNAINRLLNKYSNAARGPRGARDPGAGDDVSATLAYRAEIERRIAELSQASGDLSGLAATIEPMAVELRRLGAALSARRSAVAAKLGPMIEKQLHQLGMEKARFTVQIAPACGTLAGESMPATSSGFDAVEFIAQTNPGQLPQPLRKIASGGELSRIMLALKGILAAGDRISVLVFDEIDSNVGGRLGSIIGAKLRALAAHHQVLCITHLPQIASYGDRHLSVGKQIVGDATETRVRRVEGPERLQELAEMIGGQRITETTLAQARELLDSAQGEPTTTATPPPPANPIAPPPPDHAAPAARRPRGEGKGSRRGPTLKSAG